MVVVVSLILSQAQKCRATRPEQTGGCRGGREREALRPEARGCVASRAAGAALRLLRSHRKRRGQRCPAWERPSRASLAARGRKL